MRTSFGAVIAAAGHGDGNLLVVVLGLAGLGAVIVVGLALVALARRRSWSYVLVTAALGTLLVRTSLGALTVGGVLTLGGHHLEEHALDVVMIALLLGAVYYARTTDSTPEGASIEESDPGAIPEDRSDPGESND